MHHSSTSTYMPNFVEIKKLFVDGRTYAQTFETCFIRSSLLKSRPKNCNQRRKIFDSVKLSEDCSSEFVNSDDVEAIIFDLVHISRYDFQQQCHYTAAAAAAASKEEDITTIWTHLVSVFGRS